MSPGSLEEDLDEQAREAGDLNVDEDNVDQMYRDQELANKPPKPPSSHESPSLLYDPTAE